MKQESFLQHSCQVQEISYTSVNVAGHISEKGPTFSFKPGHFDWKNRPHLASSNLFLFYLKHVLTDAVYSHVWSGRELGDPSTDLSVKLVESCNQ